MIWTSQDAATATGGTSTKPWAASGVSIDTRSIAPGDLFVALTDVRDGHDFVAAALRGGAAAALVSRVPDDVPKDASLLIVPDVLGALTDMAVFARARTTAKVVGITGSVGKTSTKEMLRTVLDRQGTVHAAEKSFNNHWGVPLTLARMPANSDFAIIEMGMNHPGEIAPLAKLAQPDVAMITNVEAAHLEAFENLEAIAHEKAAIFSGLKTGGTAVINSDQSLSGILTETARAHGATIVTFGKVEKSDFRLSDVHIVDDTTVVRAEHLGHKILFKLTSAGSHFAQNAAGVLAVTEALGGDIVMAALDLGLWAPPPGRGTRETIVMDIVDDHMTFELIDDAFNANPASMAAALEVLAASQPIDNVGRVSEGRRIAVLGDMLELGPAEIQLHGAIAELASIEAVDIVHCAGDRMRALYKNIPKAKRGDWHPNAEQMASRAHAIVDAGDVVLVKGSKGSKVSLVVDAMRKLGHREK